MSEDLELLPFDGHEIASRESTLEARITRAAWSNLPRYDSTMPSGVVLGKRWRRSDGDGNWLGEMIFTYREWQGVEIVFRRVAFVLPGGP